jgi:acyl-coenzyme A thioesterase PaaI-like protein
MPPADQSSATVRQGPFWDVLDRRRSTCTQFLTPARPGELRATGWVVKRGRDIGFLAGELRNADGDLVATATARAAIRRAA